MFLGQVVIKRDELRMITPASPPTDRFHMTNQETESALRCFLVSRSFSLSDALTQNGATGVDIIAKSPDDTIYYIVSVKPTPD